MKQINELIQWFDDKDRVFIALSGGVDSALVAFAAFQKLGDSAIAVTADYKTLAKEEMDSAKKICSEIGIKHVLINYDELDNENFIRNDKNRCFFCRSELVNHLKILAKQHNVETLVDGTNLDDLGDYRPGIKAMKAGGIQSPLVDVGFTKNQIREISKKVGLSIFDRPSNSCLASRIPWGLQVTKERLARIEMGEIIVKNEINAKQVRVRDIDGIAKIELGFNELHLLSNKSIIQNIEKKLLQIGFTSVTVDPEGYKPGKVNVIVD